jgi:hypothetical protein
LHRQRSSPISSRTGAVVGQFETPRFVFQRAGESAAHVAEEFARKGFLESHRN